LLPSDKPTQQADDLINRDLIRACEDGQRKARLAFLLSKGADIEYRSHMNCTPLHHAAYSGSVEAVEFLIDAGADINAYDEYWGVPLGFAIVGRRMDIVKLLLEHKASVNTHCGVLGSPAHAACAARDMDVLRLLCDHGACLKTVRFTGLAIWPILVDGKGRAHSTVGQNCSPGGLAVVLGNLEAVRYCLDSPQGLSLGEPWRHIRDDWLPSSRVEGSQPLDLVVTNHLREGNSTLAMLAASNLDVGMLDLLLSKGADAAAMDTSYFDGFNAIFHAVNSEKNCDGNPGALVACVRSLQRYGASIDAQDNKGATPLMKAVEWHQDSHNIVRTLLDLGASIDVVEQEGNCALMLASVDTAELLCARRADIHLATSRGTAFSLAENDKRQVLLRHGAIPTPMLDVSVPDKGKVINASLKGRSDRVESMTL
jgi:ankyrin repeat protein